MATAESLSTSLDSNRNCKIEINNMSDVYSLINPQVYTFSGYCCHPPQPTISTKNIGLCAFTKIGLTACGTVGVLTYDLCHMEKKECTDRIAILFSVPFDYNFYDNIFGIGVITTTRECNEALYNEMYYESSGSFTRGKAKESGISHKAKSVDLRATMSNAAKAIIKVEIHDKLG